jgi:aminoglycoside 3-N-acetyltransferase
MESKVWMPRHSRSTTDAVAPPATAESLVLDLRQLGVKPGETLLVNASLSALGRVAGGAPTAVAALREAVGPTGTIVMPAGTEENSQLSRAHREVVASMSWDELRAYRSRMPAFDKHTTPSGMGVIAEALRTTDGAVRSDHPQSSFAAIGPQAGPLMADHALDSHLGEASPLAKLYARRARVLMIGVGYEYCTALHLAEYRYTDHPPTQSYSCVVAVDGGRRWTGYRDVVLDDNDFTEIGRSLTTEVVACEGYVGHAECRLLSLPAIVNFAVKWMAEHRR